MTETSYDLEDSIEIAADRARVWALVSDVRRMHEWSPQVLSTRIKSDEVGLGTDFTNLNQHGELILDHPLADEPLLSIVQHVDVGLNGGDGAGLDLPPATLELGDASRISEDVCVAHWTGTAHRADPARCLGPLLRAGLALQWPRRHPRCPEHSDRNPTDPPDDTRSSHGPSAE